jgi:hypothetical protein
MDYQGQHFDLTKKLDAIIAGVRIVCDSVAAEAEQYAQENAGWTDRTGNARRLLKGYVINDDRALGFGVAHRVKSEGKERTRDTKKGKKGEIYGGGIQYGKYLEGWDKEKQELTHEGKYPILKDTVEHFKEEFLDKVKAVIRNGESPD